eukprot:gene27215-32881_t
MLHDLRDYQELIFEHAKSDNTIAFLPTGTGKTLIACSLISHCVRNIRVAREKGTDWKKVAIFVAPTKALLNQQVDYIQKQCAERVRATVLNGDKVYEGLQIDFWGPSQWQYFFGHYEVLGMTPEVLCILLEKAILPGDAIELLVLDECHHVLSGKHPMARLCESIKEKGYRPLMLGLTASPLTTKKNKILEAYASLQDRMDAKIFIPSADMLKSLQEHVSEAKIVVAEYSDLSSLNTLQYTSLLRYALHLQEVLIASHSEADRNEYYQLVHNSLPGVFLSLLDNPEQSLECVRKLADLLKSFNQVETVLIESGPYCGILALIITLQNDKHSLFNDMQAASFKALCNKTQSLDRDVIIDQCKALTDFATKAADRCDMLRRQRVCALNVLLLIIKKVLTQLLASSLEDLTTSFIQNSQSNNKTPFGEWFVRRITVRGSMTAEDVDIVQRESISRHFFPYLCDYLTYLLNSMDIQHLRTCLIAENSLEECGLVSSKMLKCLRLLTSFFHIGNEALKDMHVIVAAPKSPPSPPSSPSSVSPLSSPPSSPSTVDLLSPPPNLSSSPSPNQRTPNAAIVFCKMRLTVQVFDFLVKQLNLASTSSFLLESAYITGSDTESHQTSALQRLRQGSVNVLFATDVVEEGVDIKSCNLVVNFDGPATAKSYIQRKGRARVLNAHIVHLLPEPFEKQKDYEDIVKFIVQEKEANKEIHKCMQLLSACAPTAERYIVPRTNASADGTAAFSIVQQHCVRVRETTSQEVYPRYDFDRLETVKEDGTKLTTFLCKLSLPVDNGGTQSVLFESGYCKSKNEAKSRSCIRAVEHLHNIGVLDDHLRLPRKVEEEVIVLHTLAATESTLSNVSSGVYIKVVPDILLPLNLSTWPKDDDCITLYLYKLEVQCTDSDLSAQPFLIKQSVKAMQHVGIALLQPLHEDVKLHRNTIYPHSSSSMSYHYVPYKQHEYSLCREKVYAMMQFHRAVMGLQTDMMEDADVFAAMQAQTDIDPATYTGFLKMWSSSGNGAFYIVFPVNPADGDVDKFSVDYVGECAQQAHVLVHNLFVLAINKARKMTSTSFKPMHYLSDYVCGNVLPGLEDVLVTSTGTNLFCSSPALNNAAAAKSLSDICPSRETFASYFSRRNSYHQSVVDQLRERPDYYLTPVMSVSSQMTLQDIFQLHHTGGSTEEEAQVQASTAENVNYLIPELSQVIGPALFFYMSLVLPSIMYRLCTLLLAVECRDHIGSLASTPDAATSLPLSLVLESITPTRAHEMYSSQRLEFYGDTVLKLLCSVDLFMKHPYFNQESLTIFRGRTISNNNLCHVAHSSSLAQYVRAVLVSSGHECVLLSPPGLCGANAPVALDGSALPTSLRNVNIQKTSGLEESFLVALYSCENQWVQSPLVGKVMADLVEAIIGALYTHKTSLDIVISFLRQLGLISSDFDEVRAEYFLRAMDSIFEGFQPLLADWQVNELQNILGYNFVNPALLHMAVTRTSKSATHNYERLELLGDAVLDFLVVVNLMQQEDLQTEGDLTNAKIAMVNNAVLAEHARRLDLGRFLQHEEMAISKALSPEASNGGDDSSTKAIKALSDIVEALVG